MPVRIQRRGDLAVGQRLRARDGTVWTVLGMRRRGGHWGTTWVGIRQDPNHYNEVDWATLKGWEVLPPAEETP